MELFKSTPTIDFMRARKWTTLTSVLFFLGALLALVFLGLNLGLDFTGGLQLEVNYAEPADLNAIRNQLSEAGFSNAVVQSYGTAYDVLISLSPKDNVEPEELRNSVLAVLPEATLKRVEFIGPQVGSELAAKGALALVLSFLSCLVYIALRFEYRLALGAIVALLHDPILILGLFALFQFEFNLPALAALLTVIGYSINDTIVVFDRLRENFRKYRQKTPVELMNLSINQTLSRTILTSGSTLLVVLALLIYGGTTLRSFSIALVIGITVGTYSSIYIAGAVAISLGLKRTDLLPAVRKEIDERP